MLHGVVSSFGFVRFVVGVVIVVPLLGSPQLFRSSGNEGIHDGPLLIGHAVDNVLNGFVILGLVLRLRIILGFGFGLGVLFGFRFGRDQRRLIIGMIKTDRLATSDDDFLLGTLAMGQIHEVDKGTRIRRTDNQTDLSDVPVNDILAAAIGHLLQPIGVNGKHMHIAVLNDLLGFLAALGFVQETVGIYAVLAVFQNGMAQDVVNIVVLMVPNNRNRHPVAMLESVPPDSSSVGANKIVSGCPATKVILQIHFELCPPLKCFVRSIPLWEHSSCCSGACPHSGPSRVSCRSSAESHSRS